MGLFCSVKVMRLSQSADSELQWGTAYKYKFLQLLQLPGKLFSLPFHVDHKKYHIFIINLSENMVLFVNRLRSVANVRRVDTFSYFPS